MPLHFTPEDFAERRRRVCADLVKEGLHGLLMFRQESMYYLTGYDTFGYVFFQCLYLGADGRLILLGDEGELAVVKVSLEGCSAEGRKPVKLTANAQSEDWATTPALSNGNIYCRSRKGTLVCLRVGGPKQQREAP